MTTLRRRPHRGHRGARGRAAALRPQGDRLIVLRNLAAIAAASPRSPRWAAWATATGHGSCRRRSGDRARRGDPAATAFIGEARRCRSLAAGVRSCAGRARPARPPPPTSTSTAGSASAATDPPRSPTCRKDGYDFGVGQMTVDLRDLPWANGQTISGEERARRRADDRLRPLQRLRRRARDRKGGRAAGPAATGATGSNRRSTRGEPRSQAPRLDLDAELQLGQARPSPTRIRPPSDRGDGVDYDHNPASPGAESPEGRCAGYEERRISANRWAVGVAIVPARHAAAPPGGGHDRPGRRAGWRRC